MFAFDILPLDIWDLRYLAVRYLAYSIFCDSIFFYSIFCDFDISPIDILRFRYLATPIFCLLISCVWYAIRHFAFRYFVMEAVWTPPPPVFPRWRKTAARSAGSPGQVTWPYLQKCLRSCHGHSAWGTDTKLSGLHKVISTYKMLSRIFDIGDLRSGQFRDLPIISLWGKIKIFVCASDKWISFRIMSQ